MKKQIALILAAVMVFALTACGGKSTMTVDNGEDGIVTVTADHAEKGSGGVGYITVADGECMVISPVLEKGTCRVTVRDQSGNVLLDKTVDGKVMSAEPLEPGEYSLLIICENPMTGTMKIMPYSVEQLEEENAGLAEALEQEGIKLR